MERSLNLQLERSMKENGIKEKNRELEHFILLMGIDMMVNG